MSNINLAFAAVMALAAPQPPCEGFPPFPPYSNAGEAAALETWTDLQWHPPACLGWPDGRYKMVIAVAGRIHAADDESLRRRIGAVSTSQGLRYWSVTEGAWRVLIKDAAALSGPEGERRKDFGADEMRPGAVLYFVEEDNRSSAPARYRMRIREATRDRIVVETENVTPIESLMLRLFPPGSLRTAYFMSRLDGDRWGFYAISASTAEANSMVKLAKASYINRARALFGHFAGINPEPAPR